MDTNHRNTKEDKHTGPIKLSHKLTPQKPKPLRVRTAHECVCNWAQL